MKGIQGYTLMELLISCALITILATISLSSLELLNTLRLKTATRDLMQQLQTARSYALQRQKPTIVCATNKDAYCTTNWSNGVATFIDENENNYADAADTLIYGIYFDSNLKIKWKAFKNKSHLAFTPEGFTDNQNGRFTLCLDSNSAKECTQLIINKAGRTRIQ